MTGTIVPLRPLGNDLSALDSIDLVAAELLADGRAGTLSAARLDALLTALQAHKNDLVAVVADLRARGLTGDPRIDAVNAKLSTAAAEAVIQVDRAIQSTDSCMQAS